MLFPASVVLERLPELVSEYEILYFFLQRFLCFIDSRKGAVNYADLGVQLDVFDEQRENDESQILDVPFRGVDINSHVDVFYAILKQVSKNFITQSCF